MANSERYPSYVTCVARVLSASSQPLSVDVLLTRIKDHRPITKGARSAVYRAIGQLFQAIPVAPSYYGWLSSLLNGSMFRHLLTSEEARRGFVMLDELEHAVFFPQFFQTYEPDDRKLSIELFGGPTIEAEAYIERKTWSLRLGQAFVEWVDELGGQGRDDLLIIVNDANPGHYTLRLQPREIRDQSLIQTRNIQMALMAEEIVAEDRRSRTAMPTAELAARLIGRGFFTETMPPDDFHYVLHTYSLLRFQNGVGYSIPTEEFDYSPALPGFAGDTANPWDGAGMDNEIDDTANTNAPNGMMDWNGMGESPFFDDADDAFEDSCPGYEAYLENLKDADSLDAPLSHSDFHLLEAELEMLVALEQEFGYLLPEQEIRKEQLAEQLFVDPETLLNGDQDMTDYPDWDEPPFWQN